MRILLISTYALGGGAAAATYRLYEALRSSGVEVRMLSLYGADEEDNDKQSYYHGTLGRAKALALKLGERLDIVRHNAFRPDWLWRCSSASTGVDISTHPWVVWADVIHLNWINQGFLSLSALAQIKALAKPIVWTLHDLWPASGLCHIPLTFTPTEATVCPRWGEGCGLCPLLAKPSPEDYSHQLSKKKAILHTEADNPIHYVAVSQRAGALFDTSYLRQGLAPCAVIPPALPKSSAGDSLAFTYPEWYSPSCDYILLAAARIDDEVKGYRLLAPYAEALRQERIARGYERPIRFVLVGRLGDSQLIEGLAIKAHSLGAVESSYLGALYRHLVSCTLSLSLFESFGQTLTESLAEGTPVLSFRSYGPEDIVEDGENGYLVEAYDVVAMARRTIDLLLARQEGGFDAETCRRSIERFAPERVAQQYISLYAEAQSPSK